MNVYLIHGIHTEPDSPVKGLIPYLKAAGFNVRYPEYGYEFAVETRIVNPIVVGTLLPCIEAGDVLIGHSNGCAIAYHLMQQGAPVAGAVFINGALETNIVRPGTCKWIDVYCNSGDTVTEAAKWGAKFGLVDQVWGELGHLGYTGSDGAIQTMHCDTTTNEPVVMGHSDIFTHSKIVSWGPYLSNRIVEKLKC